MSYIGLLCIDQPCWSPTYPSWSICGVQAQLAEQERQKQQAQAARFAVRQAELAEAAAGQPEVNVAAADLVQQAVLHSTQLSSSQLVKKMEVDDMQQTMSHVASPEAESESSGRKRRRTVVDYVALNKQLEAEAAGPSGQSVSEHGLNAATKPLSFVTNVPSAAVGVHATDGVPNQRPDSSLDGTALNVGQQHALLPQTHEGDRSI